jgi:type VI secretion system secreted protein VgrG
MATAGYTDSNRFLYLDTPMGPDQLLFKSFRGQESLSQLFAFHLELAATNATSVDFEKLIGQSVSFGVQGAEARQAARDFNGIVIEMSQGARDRTFTAYHVTVAPAVWKLTRKFQSRLFQHITVPDILKKVFQGFDVAYEIQGTWDQREYCTQYQESDFDFASRLMEEEGIYYFFKFERGSHTMVLANTPQSHPDIPDKSSLIFESVQGGTRDEERVSLWQKAQFWGSGKYTLWDHHFELPHRNLAADQLVIDSVTAGKITHKLKTAGNEAMEVYENPGRYAQRFDGIDKSGGEKPADLQNIFTDNKRTVDIRMEQTETPMMLIQGSSNCRQITSGHKFTLQRHFNADGQYVAVSVSHDGSEGSFRSGEGTPDAENHYGNDFTCIPYALAFRPPRVTNRPLIAGPQSAVVVGPAGEEIFPDKYGRVKVQFHWDREGVNNLDSSCWLRVGTMWGGQTWGAIHIPRIGQEVIVLFLEGDPDRPIIVGGVYNPDQMPPYKLPDHKTVSTTKSRSSKNGTADNYNELRFEDLKSKEQVFFHAERDKDERVKQESREWVGGNRHMIVEKSHNESIGADRNTNIGHNLVVHVVNDNDEAIDGNLQMTVAKDHQHLTGGRYAYGAGSEIHLLAGQKIIIEAGAEVTLKGPGGFIDINAMGVVIQGLLVLINSGGMAGTGSPCNPVVPHPTVPDTADDGTKFDKM